MARVRAPAVVGALAGALWLIWGHGFANYDTLYALVWGRQVADGESPSFDVSLAPTPHPLANLVGLLTAPFSPRGAETIVVVLAFVALGAVGWLVYELGARRFGPAAGVLGALVLLTREPVLSYGTRAYVDLWYLAFVLGALLVIERRRSPFVLLALAGLVRPEAWLFSAALLAWRAYRGEWSWDLVAIAAAGPVIWLASDWILTGSPVHSLTGTRENVRTLGRVTGLEHVPETLPRRIGEVLREPVLVGAAIGGVLAVWRLRERSLLLAAAGVLGVLAFCLLAAAGLPIITRYTFGVDAILAIFCGAGAFGWLMLMPGDPWRTRWSFLGGVVIVLLVVYAPSQARRLDRTRDAIATQDHIADDLWTVGLPRCPNGGGRLGAVNHRLVPQLALREDVGPELVTPAPLPRGFLGTYVTPATPEVARKFVLDPRDPSQRVARPPRGFAPVAHNASWLVLEKCSPAVHGGE